MTEELIVWQNIYSSKERGKILSGNIVAIETEKMKDNDIVCAIVDFKGIKVLIPTTEIIENGSNDIKILRNMMGAEIKFIVAETDRISSKAVASRIKAMEAIREMGLKKIIAGDKVYGKVIGIWRKYIRIEVLGMDFVIKAQDLQYRIY